MMDIAKLDPDFAENPKRPFQLPLGHKVEVRSVDKELMGSWHSGVVTGCNYGDRKVQYDNVQCDDNSPRLDDCISVHRVLDGVTSVGRKRLYYRGFIRPIPPLLNFNRLYVQFGQCVDAYYKEAWWEGVVFDHDIASEVRSIFFPDKGDLLRIEVDVLRITQDWDEYTREWKPRGIWYFLELIERFEKENLLHVSVRQIWYEVRENKAFHLLKEWTNSLTRGCVLENLVKEVIGDHSKLAAEKYYGDFELQLKKLDTAVNDNEAGSKVNTVRLGTEEKEICVDDSFAKMNIEEKSNALELSLLSRLKSASQVEPCPSTLSINTHDGYFRLEDLNRLSIPNSDVTHEETLRSVPTLLPSISASSDECFSSKELHVVCEQVPSNRKGKRKWDMAGADIVPFAEFCPDSVIEYRNSINSKRTKTSSLALNMRKHLAYLGWKVEICKEDGKPRMRYTSPFGKSYMSLATICKDWDTSTENERLLISSHTSTDIVEPANLESGERSNNTTRPITVKTSDMEDKAKRHLMTSDSPIWTNEALKSVTSLSIACEAFADGEVDNSAKAVIISEPRQNIDFGDEANAKLIASHIFSSSISIELDEICQVKFMAEVEHHHERISGVPHLTSCSDDAGAEVKDVPLVTDEEEIDVDIVLSKSKTEEEGKKLDIGLSNSATYVEGFPGALSMNYNKSFRLQGSNPISDDFCPRISEQHAEENGLQIAAHNLGIVPEAEIFPGSVYKLKRGRGSRLDLISSSNSQITQEETLCNPPSNKKRRKRNWEIAGGDMVPEAEFCPGSVGEYLKISSVKNGKAPPSLALNLRKHLAYLGWKTEICRGGGLSRIRYTSPDGKSYSSLATVCKDLEISTDQREEKKVCALSKSPALISSPVPHNIVEPAYLSETVKYYGLLGSGKSNKNTGWPRIAKPHDMEDEANKHLMASESPIWGNEPFKTFNSLATTCEPYPGKNIKNHDEANGRLIASQSFPSSILTKQDEFGQVKPMLVGEHHHGRIPPFIWNDDDVGTEVNDVREKEEVDVYLSKSNTEEEGKNSNIGLLSSSNSATHVEGFRGAPLMNHQGSNPESGDSRPNILERLAERKDKHGCQIAGHYTNIIGPDSIYKSKMEGRSRLDLVSISNFETTHVETPYCLPSILSCNEPAVNELENLNTVGQLPIKKRRKLNWEIAGRDVNPEADFCPDSVADYRKSSNILYGKTSPNLTLNTRENLVNSGWKVESCREEGFSRIHYSSPNGKSDILLDTVSKDRDTSTEQAKKKKASPYHPLISLPPSHDIVQPARIPEEKKKNTSAWPRNASSEDVQDKGNMPNNYVTTACEANVDGEVNNGVGKALVSEPKQNTSVGDEAVDKLTAIQRLPLNLPMELDGFEKEKSLAVEEYHDEGTDGVPPLTCNSLVQESVPQLDSSFAFQSSRSLFPLLLDNDVVLPRAKVYYHKKSGGLIKEGQITREGIKCNCCKSVFGLSKFEAHAGSTYHRPAANIFLEDGRSLSDCQSQLRCRDNLKMLTPSPQPKSNHDNIKKIVRPLPQNRDSGDNIKKPAAPSPQPKRGRRRSTNDSVCSVCNLGDMLTFCHHCPSSFHRECLGLKVIPEGEWFCPSCCCGICEKYNFNSGAKKIMEGSVLNCYQCERGYHVGCLLRQGEANLDRCSKGKWFCNRKCKQIFVGLTKLLGRPVVVGDGDLTWTLLKYTPHSDNFDDGDMDRVETLNNLRRAVSVMHACFDPVKEPRTKIDIVNDVIFSRGSNLKRLNFQGFYTVALSRDDELISVAAVRVYGENVAEVPLIGTRFEYRRHGMCCLLMNVLEKKLMELGVERLVFLATPSVLSTWTTSLGFSRISESERLNLLSYTFLDFQGTAMWNKILTISAQPTRAHQNFQDGVDGSDNTDVNKKGASSEVCQAELISVEILNQGAGDVGLSDRGINGGIGTMPLILRV